MKSTRQTGRLAVGITGGIGSGKTEAVRILGSLGAKILNADRLAAQLIVIRPEIQKRIRKNFGDRVLPPGALLDRNLLARMIFRETRLRKKLNAILHPCVLEELRSEIARFKGSGRGEILIVEAALIFEACAEGLFDYVIAVDAPQSERIERIMRRDNLSRAEVLQRIRSQMPAEAISARADFVIRNVGNKKRLETSCRFLHRVLVRLAGGHKAGS